MGFSPCSSSVSTITADDHHPETAAAIKNKRMIVFALVAPNQKKERKSPPPPRRPTTSTSVSVLKLDDESVAENVISRLNLSGCAVVSKGVLVVEGPTGSVNRFSKLMGLAQKRPDSVIWRARVRRPRFGKFSVLRHCTSDFAVRKFFADHGASQYWDQVLRSKPNGSCF